MPVVCVFMVVLNRHVLVTLKVSADDYTFAYFFTLSLALTIAAAVHFGNNPELFDVALFWQGFLASGFNLISCFIAGLAFATGGPVGVIAALLSSQCVILTILFALVNATVPNFLQIIGLITGVLGALVISIPD